MQFEFGDAKTVYEALREVSNRHAEKIAVISNNIEINYKDLISHVDAIAVHLRAIGIKKGDRVAVYAQNCPEFLYAYVATAKIGAVFVPINFNLTLAEVKYVLAHSDARVVFFGTSVSDITSVLLPDLTIRPLNELSETQIVNDIGADVVSEDDDLIIVYTSGSTGVPKAVVIDHKGQMGAAKSLIELWGLSPSDVTVVGAPFGFLLGLSTSTLVTLFAGAKVDVLRRFHPGEVFDAISKHKVTIYNGVPTMFVMMLEYAEQSKDVIDLTSVRSLVCSGAPLSQELSVRFLKAFGKELQNYFGMTEAYPLIGRLASHVGTLPERSIGVAAPGAKVRFVDADGSDCPPSIPGEMLAKGPSTMRRYHKNPELTAASFRDGWFLTGDVGCRDNEGHMYITGRTKDLIIRGGNNIAPAEIEAAIMRHPDVADVAVIGVDDPKYGEVPVAFVVARGNRSITAAQVLDFATKNMANFKIPTHVFVEDEMPLGKTNKIDKLKLKARFAEYRTRSQEEAAST